MALIHKEGYPTLTLVLLFVVVSNVLLFMFYPVVLVFGLVVSFIILVFFLQFFRNPVRSIPQRGEELIYAPADGKVVVIEKTVEQEYYKEERIQLSIFMSPVNVHVNRSPISGVVKFFKYHPGKYLVAWHPKSSEENERTSIVIEGSNVNLLMRQIAGMVARRIIFYPKEGESVDQGQEVGFIKFGSRVDLFLPMTTEILVQPGDIVRAADTVIARV
ncbi:MAG: phosphatidylserine decarboxylase family protein [Saprospirales bacterium]|nr:MAG: phosphatidylserine decarboxylase family protein [Saprospirales bacterium]